MKFKVTRQDFGKYAELQLQNIATGEYASIIVDCGAIVNRLVLCKDVDLYSVIAGYDTAEEMETLAGSRGIKLSPFPNRIADGHYEFEGVSLQLPINKPKENNAIHGFLQQVAYKTPRYEVTNQKASVTAEYEYDGGVSGYPFPFLISLVYELTEGSLGCKTTLTNLGETNMPLGDGWHPYFSFGDNNEPADGWMLQLPPCSRLLTDERLIPNGIEEAFDGFVHLTTIGNSTFDTGFELQHLGSTAVSRLHHPQRGLTLELHQETGLGKYNFLQVFIPPNRKSVALEPMTCPANAFNSGKGLIILPPKGQFQAFYQVKLL